jgi:hypothetical protein
LPGFFDEKSKGRGEEENVLDSLGAIFTEAFQSLIHNVLLGLQECHHRIMKKRTSLNDGSELLEFPLWQFLTVPPKN